MNGESRSLLWMMQQEGQWGVKIRGTGWWLLLVKHVPNFVLYKMVRIVCGTAVDCRQERGVRMRRSEMVAA